MCIEFDRIQRFKPVKCFSTKQNDQIKNLYYEENNVKLLRIRYNSNIEKP